MFVFPFLIVLEFPLKIRNELNRDVEENHQMVERRGSLCE